MQENENGKKKSEQSESDIESWLNKKIDRKHFLQRSEKLTKLMIGSSMLGPLLPMACSSQSTSAPTPTTPPKTLENPFQLGVASGDPLSDGVVLWTRLAPEPLYADGGMETDAVDVHWEVAEDQSFKKVVQQGTAVAKTQHAHSIHVELEGLASNSEYYYRFKRGEEVSPIGRTKTLPEENAHLDELNFAFASCQSFRHGYYTAFEHMVKEELDVLFFLGDYIYQDGGKSYIGRDHIPRKTIQSLADYRIRHAQYKTDPLLQAAHAAFPWIATIDDHEIKNNWAGDISGANKQDTKAIFADRKANALQAYYEHMPLRESAMPGADIRSQLYRSFTYGDLAKFNVLDTRQFRSNYACNTSGYDDCDERLDPSRTMLGDKQEQWLFDELKQSSSRWNVLPQQVFMAQQDRDYGPGVAFSMDRWDGYVATRKRLFDVVKKHGISNFTVLTGDIHRNFVSNLLEDFTNPNSSVLGTELVTTSITSGKNGSPITPSGKSIMKENPWIKFANDQRGYVRCRVTPEQLRADYRVVPYVDKKGAPIHTAASFVVKNGQPGALQV